MWRTEYNIATNAYTTKTVGGAGPQQIVRSSVDVEDRIFEAFHQFVYCPCTTVSGGARLFSYAGLHLEDPPFGYSPDPRNLASANGPVKA